MENGDEDLLKNLEEQIHELIRSTSVAPATLYQHWLAFIYAVDWTEPWLKGLLAFYISLIAIIVVFQDNMNVQVFIYILLAVIVFLSETFNDYCSIHWNEFARQNYFDKHGTFTTTVFCFPLLLILIFQLVRNLIVIFMFSVLIRLSV